MKENDILLHMKDAVREELSKVANEEIEKLVHKFRCEIGKHKTEIVSGLVNRVELLMNHDIERDRIVIQINIRNGERNA